MFFLGKLFSPEWFSTVGISVDNNSRHRRIALMNGLTRLEQIDVVHYVTVWSVFGTLYSVVKVLRRICSSNTGVYLKEYRE